METSESTRNIYIHSSRRAQSRRPTQNVFLFVHEKRVALTFPTSSWIRLRFNGTEVARHGA
jgi:hypothetical protein